MKQGLLAERERPTAGAAAANARTKQARQDVLAALVSILGRDLVLGRVAEITQSESRALAVADELGLNADAWQEDRSARQKQTTQTTLHTAPSASYHEDARHAPEVTAAILANAPMDEINRQIALASQRIESEKPGRHTIGPDARHEPTQAPVQRTIQHRDVEFNADADDSQPSGIRRVSAPPSDITASPREA
jgi:hypothetical protein